MAKGGNMFLETPRVNATFKLALTLGSWDGTGRQHFSCTLDDRNMADVEVNVVIALIVAVWMNKNRKSEIQGRADCG